MRLAMRAHLLLTTWLLWLRAWRRVGAQTVCPRNEVRCRVNAASSIIFRMECGGYGTLTQLPPACDETLVISTLVIRRNTTSVDTLQAMLYKMLSKSISELHNKLLFQLLRKWNPKHKIRNTFVKSNWNTDYLSNTLCMCQQARLTCISTVYTSACAAGWLGARWPCSQKIDSLQWFICMVMAHDTTTLIWSWSPVTTLKFHSHYRATLVQRIPCSISILLLVRQSCQDERVPFLNFLIDVKIDRQCITYVKTSA